MRNVSATRMKKYYNCPFQYKLDYEVWCLQLKTEALYIWLRYHDTLHKHYMWQVIQEDEQGFDLYQKYLENPVEWNVVELEAEHVFNIDWVEIPIKVIIDRKDEDKIVEYKTSSFDYKWENVDNIQTDLYIYYYWLTTGINYPMYYSVINKKKVWSKKYKPQIMVVERTEEYIKTIPDKVKEFIENVQNKKFDPTPWKHCWYCGFWPKWTNNCKYYDKPRKWNAS